MNFKNNIKATVKTLLEIDYIFFIISISPFKTRKNIIKDIFFNYNKSEINHMKSRSSITIIHDYLILILLFN